MSNLQTIGQQAQASAQALSLLSASEKKPPTGSDGRCFRKSYREDFSC